MIILVVLGSVILLCLLLKLICPSPPSPYTRAQQEKKLKYQKWKQAAGYNENAALFCKSHLDNKFVQTMLNELLEYIKGLLVGQINRSRENYIAGTMTMFIDGTKISRSTTLDSNEPAFSFYYTDYGILSISEEYKIYGLALTLNKLIAERTQELTSSIPELKSFHSEAVSEYRELIDKDVVFLRFTWTIEQHKFIEL